MALEFGLEMTWIAGRADDALLVVSPGKLLGKEDVTGFALEVKALRPFLLACWPVAKRVVLHLRAEVVPVRGCCDYPYRAFDSRLRSFNHYGKQEFGEVEVACEHVGLNPEQDVWNVFYRGHSFQTASRSLAL
jgi:hypothetical protein